MDKNAKIFVAGHNGLVGSAIVRQLQKAGFHNLVCRTRQECDLLNQSAVDSLFETEKPDYVFLAAAKVGGIHANNTYPGQFIYENLMIQNHVIHASYQHHVKRLLFLGSSCIYPKHCQQPMKETDLLTGELEPTNRPYALAKIAGIEMCWAYNRQYGTQYLSVMPTNLYGTNDNFHLQNSHVIPALMRKMHEAKEEKASSVEIWGTGTPYREFLHADDMANACVFLMQLEDQQYHGLLASKEHPPLMNIGCGHDLSIKQLAELIQTVVGFHGQLKFNPNYPDGTPKKMLDVSRLKHLGWTPKISLLEGLKEVYQHFQQQVEVA